ncbi:hypothetical protein JXA47_10575 [Candidatus Sumerlaeota bacterium]|nr:hypothetical protein [Candidatus Sumerlaeota bacterium]
MRHLFFTGLLAGVGLCFAQAQTFPEADIQTLSIDDLIEDLRADSTPGNAERALQEILRRGRVANLPALEDTLLSPDSQQRLLAAEALLSHPGYVPSPAWFEALIANFASDDIRGNATRAYLLLRRSRPYAVSPLPPQIVARLHRALDSEDRQLGFHAALALSWASDTPPLPQQFEILVRHFGSDSVELNATFAWEAYRRAMETLRWRGDSLPPQIVSLLEHDLLSDDTQRRHLTAAALLMVIEHEPDTRHLMEVVDLLRSDSLPDIPHAARWALWRTRDSMDPAVQRALERVLSSDDDQQRYLAATILCATPSLGAEGRYRVADVLIESLRSESGVQRAWNARNHLWDLGYPLPPYAVQGLERALDSDDHLQRQLAALTLVNHVDHTEATPSDRLCEVLVEGLRDDDLVFNAHDSLDFLLRNRDLGTGALEAALDSNDTQQRFLAAYILGATGRGERLDDLAEILIPNLREDDVMGNALMACYALCHLGEAIVPHLTPHMEATDPQLQAGALLVLRDILEPPRTLSDLEERRQYHAITQDFADPAWQRIIHVPWFWQETRVAQAME